MSLEIKTQQPISIVLPFDNATLAQLQSIISGITEIVGVYIDTRGDFGGGNIYRVLAPYAFTPPTTAVFGDQFTVSYLVPNRNNGEKTIQSYDQSTTERAPSRLLAQDTVSIWFYEK